MDEQNARANRRSRERFQQNDIHLRLIWAASPSFGKLGRPSLVGGGRKALVFTESAMPADRPSIQKISRTKGRGGRAPLPLLVPCIDHSLVDILIGEAP